MKQFTRVISRPDNIPPDVWRTSLTTIFLSIEHGHAVAQGAGIHSAMFVDLSNQTIIITIIQFEHASQSDATEVHQAITEFIENLSKL